MKATVRRILNDDFRPAAQGHPSVGPTKRARQVVTLSSPRAEAKKARLFAFLRTHDRRCRFHSFDGAIVIEGSVAVSKIDSLSLSLPG
jgi:hypothetical protein